MNGMIFRDFDSRVDEVECYWRHLTSAARMAEYAHATEPDLAALIAELAGSVSPGLRKTFDYSSMVVSLYGCIEEYVESLVEHCAVVIEQSFDSYMSLPEVLRKHHERLSLKLADQISQGYYRGFDSLPTVIDNLHRCLNNDQNFRLNVPAFSIHTANIRHNVVRDMFAAISIPNIDSAIELHPLTVELMYDLGRSRRDSHFYLNDLADRRNLIAHGERPSDVISASMMQEYFRATRVFGEALFEGALLGVLEFALPSFAASIGSPTRTFNSNRVVCFETPAQITLQLGDRLLWRSQQKWKMARLETIQIDRVEHASAFCPPGTRVGLGISAHGSSGAEYFRMQGW
jgi:hypothetical protein